MFSLALDSLVWPADLCSCGLPAGAHAEMQDHSLVCNLGKPHCQRGKFLWLAVVWQQWQFQLADQSSLPSSCSATTSLPPTCFEAGAGQKRAPVVLARISLLAGVTLEGVNCSSRRMPVSHFSRKGQQKPRARGGCLNTKCLRLEVEEVIGLIQKKWESQAAPHLTRPPGRRGCQGLLWCELFA